MIEIMGVCVLSWPTLPQTKEDLDDRSAKTRLAIAEGIQTYGGVSIKD